MFLAGSQERVQLRGLLLKYATGKDWEPLEDWAPLLAAARSACPELHALLLSYPDPRTCPVYDKDLLRGLAARSSLTGFIRRAQAVVPILDKLVREPHYRVCGDAAALPLLTDACPQLLTAIKHRELNAVSECERQAFRGLLRLIADKLRPTFAGLESYVPPSRIPVTVEQGGWVGCAQLCFSVEWGHASLRF